LTKNGTNSKLTGKNFNSKIGDKFNIPKQKDTFFTVTFKKSNRRTALGQRLAEAKDITL